MLELAHRFSCATWHTMLHSIWRHQYTSFNADLVNNAINFERTPSKRFADHAKRDACFRYSINRVLPRRWTYHSRTSATYKVCAALKGIDYRMIGTLLLALLICCLFSVQRYEKWVLHLLVLLNFGMCGQEMGWKSLIFHSKRIKEIGTNGTIERFALTVFNCQEVK